MLVPGSDGALSVDNVLPNRDVMLDLAERTRRKIGPLLPLFDRIALRWLDRTASPYAEELRRVSASVPQSGVALLNLAQEWGCTTALMRRDGGWALVRVFDWELDGLGQGLLAHARIEPAGNVLSLTWPLFVGDLSVVCAGRFAAAINQAPFERRRLGPLPFPEWADWLADLIDTYRSDAMPPSHLLRHVSARATGFRDAVRQLTETPICRAAIFVVAGTGPDDAAIVERLPTRANVLWGDGCAGNHWFSPGWPGRGRDDSRERVAAMCDALRGGATPTSCWSRAPVLNPRTRYAALLGPQGEVEVDIVEQGRVVGSNRLTFVH